LLPLERVLPLELALAVLLAGAWGARRPTVVESRATGLVPVAVVDIAVVNVTVVNIPASKRGATTGIGARFTPFATARLLLFVMLGNIIHFPDTILTIGTIAIISQENFNFSTHFSDNSGEVYRNTRVWGKSKVGILSVLRDLLRFLFYRKGHKGKQTV
jgi:hypothetical protein